MSESYRQISPDLANQIKLIMTDVDGTLTAEGTSVGSVVLEVVSRLHKQGIIVGLVSGRTLPELESLASDLAISGPIIAENGGVAKLKANGELMDLGYSRQPALKALEKLRTLFPDTIKERGDNRVRMIDLVIQTSGIEIEELTRHVEDVQIVDSGYILHLMQKGISKGRTLMRILGELEEGEISPAEVMVFGDALTDISLFELFPNSVLVINPRLRGEYIEQLKKYARYMSDLPFEEGFAQVAMHIVDTRARRV